MISYNGSAPDSLCRIAALCRRRLMLTGTPLQNDLDELQNLLSFLLPDVFRADVAAELAEEQVCPTEEPAACTMVASLYSPLALAYAWHRNVPHRLLENVRQSTGTQRCACVTMIHEQSTVCRQGEGAMDALAERMKALLGPFVLRRLKSEVASQLVLKQQRVQPPPSALLHLPGWQELRPVSRKSNALWKPAAVVTHAHLK